MADVLIQSTTYYVYENWTVVKGGKARVHRGNCSHCRFGKGQDKPKNPEKNGIWHGSFYNYDQAWEFALSLGRKDTRNCQVCAKEDT